MDLLSCLGLTRPLGPFRHFGLLKRIQVSDLPMFVHSKSLRLTTFYRNLYKSLLLDTTDTTLTGSFYFSKSFLDNPHYSSIVSFWHPPNPFPLTSRKTRKAVAARSSKPSRSLKKKTCLPRPCQSGWPSMADEAWQAWLQNKTLWVFGFLAIWWCLMVFGCFGTCWRLADLLFVVLRFVFGADDSSSQMLKWSQSWSKSKANFPGYSCALTHLALSVKKGLTTKPLYH